MNRYRITREIGGGAFGMVYEAEDTITGQVVAIKQIKQPLRSWKECVGLREVASLTKIPKHPHVVRLRQLVFENSRLNFVFEFLPRDLLSLMKSHRGPIPEAAVRRIMWQLLHGLHHMHRHGFFHRDLKPENLLCVGEKIETADIKICDLGQAREVRSRPPYTEYVSTRWYRAPEVLLRSRYYNSPVDMWAAGVTMAELFAGRPAFPGTSEVNQLYLLLEALGPPSHEYWADGVRQMKALGLHMPRTSAAQSLAALCPRASAPALHLLSELLHLNPARRATAASALASDWFAGMPPVVVPSAAGSADEDATGSAQGEHATGRASAAALSSSVGPSSRGGRSLALAASASLRPRGARGTTSGSTGPSVAVAAATRVDGRGHARSASVPQTRPKARLPSLAAGGASMLSGVPEGRSRITGGAGDEDRGLGAAGHSRRRVALASAAAAIERGQSQSLHGNRPGALSAASGVAASGLTSGAGAGPALSEVGPLPGRGSGVFEAGDSSASLIAMARELGVGVSPVHTPHRAGVESGGRLADFGGARGFTGASSGAGFAAAGGATTASEELAKAGTRVADVSREGFAPDGASLARSTPSSRGACFAPMRSSAGGAATLDGRLSPIQDAPVSDDLEDKQQMSLDTDQLEALLGSLGQGTVV